MQKRRADMLELLLEKLNPQHYMSSCRALMFEVADALTMLREFTEEKIQVCFLSIILNPSRLSSFFIILSNLIFG